MIRFWIAFVCLGILSLSAAAQTASPLAEAADYSQFNAWLEITGQSLDEGVTAFAPTNEAIDRLPGVVREVLESDSDLLTRVVMYHLVDGTYRAGALVDGSLMTTEGDPVTLVIGEDRVTVDGVRVTTPDLVSEGVIVHGIDGVLVPPISLPDVDPLEVSGDLVIAGSSTVYPLTQRMADFFSEEGYSDTIVIDNIGTGAGFERFCIAAETDIANASRAIREEESEACRANDREPLEFRVGTDTLAIVVSADNTF